jgi:hypothetical protein
MSPESTSRRLRGPVRAAWPAAVLLPILVSAAGCGGSSSRTPTAGPAPTATSQVASATSPGTAAGSAPASPAATENNPVGDIPDSIGYVRYTDPSQGFSIEHPDGWAEQHTADGAVFSDKLNQVAVTVAPARAEALTVASVRAHDVPSLTASEPAFALVDVRATRLPAGPAILVVYRRNSAPDPVTGRTYRDEVQRYELQTHGKLIALELAGTVGSDNVDPYTRITNSLHVP